MKSLKNIALTSGITLTLLSNATIAFAETDARAEANADARIEHRQNKHDRAYRMRLQGAGSVKARIDVLRSLDSDDRSDFIQSRGETTIRNRLDGFIDNRIDYLMRIKARIESNDGLDDEQKAEFIARIDASIAELKEKKALLVDEQNGALVDTIVDIHAQHERDAETVHEVRTAHLQARVKHMINKAERLFDRFMTRVENLEEEGVDVSILLRGAAVFEGHFETAEQHVQLAIEAFVEAQSSDEPRVLIRKGIELAKEAKAELKQGAQALQKAIKEFRSSVALDLEASASVDVQ